MSPRDDVLEVEGVVEESLPNATFRVHLDSGQAIFAHLSGKMRMNYIKILPGDRVIAEMSVYDLTKGRITRRLPIQSATQIAADTSTSEQSEPPAITKQSTDHLSNIENEAESSPENP